MFSQICATGIEDGVLAFNTVRDALAPPFGVTEGAVAVLEEAGLEQLIDRATTGFSPPLASSRPGHNRA